MIKLILFGTKSNVPQIGTQAHCLRLLLPHFGQLREPNSDSTHVGSHLSRSRVWQSSPTLGRLDVQNY